MKYILILISVITLVISIISCNKNEDITNKAIIKNKIKPRPSLDGRGLSIYNIKDPKQLKIFAEYLKDEDVQYRIAAVKHLISGDARVIPLLKTALQDKDIAVRALAANGLYRLGDTKTAEPILKEAIKNGKYISMLFYEIDGKMKCINEIFVKSLLIEADENNNNTMKQAILLKLSEIDERNKKIDYYRKNAADIRHEKIRKELTEGKIIYGPKIKQDHCIRQYLDKNPAPHKGEYKRAAIERLLDGDNKVIPILEIALKDKDRRIRIMAAQGLCRFGHTKTAMSVIKELVRDGYIDFLFYGTKDKLKCINEKLSKPILIEATKHKSDRVKAGAAFYLITYFNEKEISFSVVANIKNNTKTTGNERIEIFNDIVSVLRKIGNTDCVLLLNDIWKSEQDIVIKRDVKWALEFLGKDDLVGKYLIEENLKTNKLKKSITF